MLRPPQPTATGNSSDDREYVSVREAARLTSLGRSKLYELMGRGQLEYVKIDKRRLILRSSISALGAR